MLRFSHTAVGVQQGRAFLFSAFEDNGPMWTGNGPRVQRHAVSFPESAAIRWIKKQDPLGYYNYPRTMLRAVGRAAFDRAAEMLLRQLENDKL